MADNQIENGLTGNKNEKNKDVKMQNAKMWKCENAKNKDVKMQNAKCKMADHQIENGLIRGKNA